MSDNEVIVTIEPELLDFETTHKAPSDLANSKPWLTASHLAARLISRKEDPVTQVVFGPRRCHD